MAKTIYAKEINMLQQIRNDGPMGGETMALKRRSCEPDYEKLIADTKDDMAKCVNLKHALLEYIGDRAVSGHVAEMVGELVTEQRQLVARLQSFMTLQDKAGAE